MRRKVLWLDSRKARDRQRAGGKASALARLVSLGFRVPKGFVIPAGTCLDDALALAKDLEEARSRLREPLAVRSSLVEEDGIHQSFAGQLESVLNVEGSEDLTGAIQRVAASLTQPALRTYTERHAQQSGRPTTAMGASDPPAPPPLTLAILVQDMVSPVVAGVAFSADPLTGRSTVVMEAVRHLGDNLAQGRVEPDRFAVDPRGIITTEDRLTLDVRDFPNEVVEEIASTVRRVAAHFGTPQDVEWAWDGERLFLLQARPITSFAGQSVYSRKLVGDMTPGPLKHLVWSTNTLGMVEGVFGKVFTLLIGKNDYDFRCILQRIRSRAYVNTTFVGELLSEVGLPRNLFEAIAREEKVPRPLRLNLKLLFKAPKFLTLFGHHVRMDGTMESALRAHADALDRFRSADWSAGSAPELLERARELLELHRKLQGFIMYGSMNLAIRTRLLKRYVARHAPEVDPSQLLIGLRGIKSMQPNRELEAIAGRASDLPETMVELLQSGDDHAIRESLRETDRGKRLLVEVDDFLGRYGFLSASGTNFGEPTWAEEPGPLWTALGRLLRNGTQEAFEPAPLREAAKHAVLSRLRPLQGRRFLRRLEAAARFLELRERIGLLMTRDTYQLRRLFLAIGHRLVGLGKLGNPEDVFLLYFEELEEVVQGSRPPEDLHLRIREREEEIALDREVDLPETILGDAIPPAGFGMEAGPLLTGIGASAGVIQGRARVVRTLSEAPAVLSDQDILVVPFSDVGWTPLFATVGGVVAECGGQLSHTAIVAREYGLPAVVGVRGAMERIRDGQTLSVDGASGKVVLVGEEADQVQP